MSDFWLGVIALPLGAVAVGAAFLVLVLVVDVSERIGVRDFKLWPAKWNGREDITAVVATARHVRYMWIPGVHVVFCRTQNYGRDPKDQGAWLSLRNDFRSAIRRYDEAD